MRGIPLCCNVQTRPLEPHALVPIDNMHLPSSDSALSRHPLAFYGDTGKTTLERLVSMPNLPMVIYSFIGNK